MSDLLFHGFHFKLVCKALLSEISRSRVSDGTCRNIAVSMYLSGSDGCLASMFFPTGVWPVHIAERHCELVMVGEQVNEPPRTMANKHGLCSPLHQAPRKPVGRRHSFLLNSLHVSSFSSIDHFLGTAPKQACGSWLRPPLFQLSAGNFMDNLG